MAIQIAQHFQPFLLRAAGKHRGVLLIQQSGIFHRLAQRVELCFRLAFQFQVSAVVARFSQGKTILRVGSAIGAD